jgi:hypothetical protein
MTNRDLFCHDLHKVPSLLLINYAPGLKPHSRLGSQTLQRSSPLAFLHLILTQGISPDEGVIELFN